MIFKRMREQILDKAIRGQLVPQLQEEGVVDKIGNAPSEVPFDIPGSWKWIKISDVVDVRDGTHDSPKYVENGVPFVTSKNLKDGTIDFSTVKFISQKDHESFIQRSNVEPGDILMAMIGSIGNAVMVPNNVPDFSIKNVALFKHKEHKLISFDFLLVLLKSLESIMSSQSSGSVQKFVPLKYLRNMAIPLPPIAEQKRIAAKIESLFGEIDRAEKAYEELQSLANVLRGQILQKAIQGKLVPQLPEDGVVEQIGEAPAEVPFEIPDSWKWVSARHCFELISGRDLTKNDISEQLTSTSKIPYITGASQIKNGEIIINRWTSKPVVCSELNDLLLTCKGTVGETAINKIGNVHIARQIMALRAHKHVILGEYLTIYINCISKQLSKEAKSMIPGISRTTILNKFLPIPPLAEQKRIVAKVETLLEQVDLMTK
ncbi:restriction endonuclease subunit S [uncultured Anaerobiospirillum sp.]|uniref:restriction endonuclease subunit S n=1 Tax=uncultured Anaerobiospirillum sp. TaxID=265728 RepID=UPI00280514CC|nr:restriction endonuclease subunit S [uncultured Anaerobiospirillum sp.]